MMSNSRAEAIRSPASTRWQGGSGCSGDSAFLRPRSQPTRIRRRPHGRQHQVHRVQALADEAQLFLCSQRLAIGRCYSHNTEWPSRTSAEASLASDRPWINNGRAGVAEILFVSCDDGQLSTNGQSSQHGVRQVIIERFTPPPFLFRYPGTHTGVGNGPIEEPLFKEGLKECL